MKNSTNSSKPTKFYICSCTHRQTPKLQYVFFSPDQVSSGLKLLSQGRVEKASSVLLGSPPVYMSSSDKLAARLHIATTSLPALLVVKDGDADRPAGQWQLKASHNADDIKLWLLRYDSDHRRES